MRTPSEKREAVVKKIAQDYLRLETLKSRNSDSLDFHGLSVWAIRQAMELAYIAGQESMKQPVEGMVMDGYTVIRR